jgi:putative ubiquitin-RnfH superfamily antitoxin RatB of RatAB toxin-antitoxin module
MATSKTIRVEIVFGLPGRQELVPVNVAPDTNCAAAISQSGIAANFPEFDLPTLPIAIWGRPAEHGDRLKDGDRVEILRPLEIDPRDARRQLAIDGQFMGGVTPGHMDEK